MATADESLPYLLGTTDAEHERLIRQGQLLAPFTERFFRSAGIAEGHRVLDIGSGVGDVALLLARLVGPTGRIVGIDIDSTALAKARDRAARSDLRNVQFIERSVEEFSSDAPFDAAVGRLILQFLPNPARVLRTLAGLVRPAGVLAFQEPSYITFLNQAAHLPLRKACANLTFETFRKAGVRTNMEITLYQGFQEAGLPKPHMSLDAPLGHDSTIRRWLFDLMCTIRPRLEEHEAMHDEIGDFATLEQRLDSELDEYNSYAGCIALVGAWSRKPDA